MSTTQGLEELESIIEAAIRYGALTVSRGNDPRYVPDPLEVKADLMQRLSIIMNKERLEGLEGQHELLKDILHGYISKISNNDFYIQKKIRVEREIDVINNQIESHKQKGKKDEYPARGKELAGV